jgi:hypothetical protein
LLENESSSLQAVILDGNPGLLENEDNTRRFSTALFGATPVTLMYLNFCQASAPAITALLHAAAVGKKVNSLYAYDHVQLQAGQDLERLLENIPTVKISCLRINVDFTDESVISSFHSNTIIQRLYGENGDEIHDGPVADIMKRNQRLFHASDFLDRNLRRRFHLASGPRRLNTLLATIQEQRLHSKFCRKRSSCGVLQKRH